MQSKHKITPHPKVPATKKTFPPGVSNINGKIPFLVKGTFSKHFLPPRWKPPPPPGLGSQERLLGHPGPLLRIDTGPSSPGYRSDPSQKSLLPHLPGTWAQGTVGVLADGADPRVQGILAAFSPAQEDPRGSQPTLLLPTRPGISEVTPHPTHDFGQKEKLVASTPSARPFPGLPSRQESPLLSGSDPLCHLPPTGPAPPRRGHRILRPLASAGHRARLGIQTQTRPRLTALCRPPAAPRP